MRAGFLVSISQKVSLRSWRRKGLAAHACSALEAFWRTRSAAASACCRSCACPAFVTSCWRTRSAAACACSSSRACPASATSAVSAFAAFSQFFLTSLLRCRRLGRRSNAHQLLLPRLPLRLRARGRNLCQQWNASLTHSPSARAAAFLASATRASYSSRVFLATSQVKIDSSPLSNRCCMHQCSNIH